MKLYYNEIDIYLLTYATFPWNNQNFKIQSFLREIRLTFDAAVAVKKKNSNRDWHYKTWIENAIMTYWATTYIPSWVLARSFEYLRK